jgi:hypothetical protein
MRARRLTSLLGVIGFLLVTAHRLPAPIQEIPESPTPVPSEQVSKPRHSAKPKPAPEEATGTETKPPAREAGKIFTRCPLEICRQLDRDHADHSLGRSS